MSTLLASLYLPPRFAMSALLVSVVLAATSLAAHQGLAASSVLLALCLSWASLVDIHRFILPDLITLGLTIAGLVFHASADLASTLPFVIGAVAGYLSLFAVAWLYRRRRGRHGLGMGDAKLFAAAGAWLGWAALPTVLLIASGTAIFAFVAIAALNKRVDRDRPIPFGPFLAIGFWAVWLFGFFGGYDA